MSNTEQLLCYEPGEVIFPGGSAELNKQVSTSIRLLNKTDNYVFFKLLSTNHKRYGVQPNIGVLLPRSVCDIKVTTRLKEAPRSMRSKDWFMIKSAVAPRGATTEDPRRMFNREAGHVFQECKLQVVFSRPELSSESFEINNSPNVPEVTSPDMGPGDTVAEVTSPETGTDDNVAEQMSSVKLLDVQPPELNVPSNPVTDYSCLLKLSNVSVDHVAFRIKTMSPRYIVQPTIGRLPPQSTCDITVKMQVVPSDVQSEDKFLIQSMANAAAATIEDIQNMFDNTKSPIRECELQVVSIPEEENNNTVQADELFFWGIVICIFLLVSCYIMKQMLTLIWGFIMLGAMLTMKMTKKLVSESVEDWVLKALTSIVVHVWTQASPLILRKWTSKL